MTGRSPQVQDAAALRRAFDLEFTKPAAAEQPPAIDLIVVRSGETAYAVRMSQVAGLHADLGVTACPTPLPEFMGSAGLHGVLTPVYDLAALLGHPSVPCRWAMLAKGGALAFAFAGFEGHFRVEPSAIAARRGAASTPHAAEIVTAAGEAWPMLHIPALVAAIRRRLPQTRSEAR